MKSLLSLFVVALLALAEASATEFIVASAAQISTVMTSQAHAGDTLTMTSGTWTNQLIVFKGSGTSLHPILLRAQGGYGSVILNGTSTLRIGGNYLVVDGLRFEGGYSSSGDVIEFRSSSGGTYSNYSRLTNSAVINYNPALNTTDYKWISLYGTHNRVDHCYASGKTHSGTTLVVWRSTTAADYHRIDHNYFGPRPLLGVNGAETIRVGTSDQSQSGSFTTVESNYFQECNGEIEIISNKSCDNIYRHNTFVNCIGTLTLRHGNRCRVEGNFIFGNRLTSAGGIRIIGEDHVVINNYVSGTTGNDERAALSMMDGIPSSPLNGYWQVKRAIVAFNTFVDNTETFDFGVGNSPNQNLEPLDCTIANNVVLTTHGPIIVQSDTGTNFTWQKNLLYGASVGISPVPTGITVVDPKLTTAGSDGLRHLSALSPAINASEGTFSQVTDDMDGQPRDGQADVGADEFSIAPVTSRPLTANDVGPNAVSYSVTVIQRTHGNIAPGSISVHSGETCSFTIIPAAGYHLDSLLVDGVFVADSITGYTFVNVLTSHTIEAIYGTTRYSLSTNALNGSIVKSPDQPTYDSASTVTLTGLPAPGYHFSGWSGDVSGSTNPVTLLMNTNKSVTAIFALNQYPLTINIHGSGNVTRTPDQSLFNHGDSVRLAAVPTFGWEFSGWTGDTVYGGNTLILSMTETTTVTANFAQLPVTRSISFSTGWNLLSLPLTTESPAIVTLFPAASGSAYKYAHGYLQCDSVNPGVGFWLKYPGADSLALAGVPVLNDTIQLQTGWNMIGTISDPIAVQALSGDSPVFSGLTYYSFSQNGYEVSDTLRPGLGYWVKAPVSGNLYISLPETYRVPAAIQRGSRIGKPKERTPKILPKQR